MIVAATADGKEVAGRLAVRLVSNGTGAGVLTDVVEVKEGGAAVHSIFGGSFTVDAQANGLPILSVRPGAIEAAPAAGAGERVDVEVPAQEGTAVRITNVEPNVGGDRPELTEASIVVSGGRGVGSAEKFSVVEALADVNDRVARLLAVKGNRTVDSFHKELGNIMWEYCGMERTDEGLRHAIELIRALKADFWSNVRVLGGADTLNQSLERAGRVADFFELGELMCIDALHRRESCGGHFRAESQTEDGEALRHDDEFLYVGAWEYTKAGAAPILHREPLEYEFIELKQRSYK